MAMVRRPLPLALGAVAIMEDRYGRENVDTLTSGKVRFQGGPDVPAYADLSECPERPEAVLGHFTKADVNSSAS